MRSSSVIQNGSSKKLSFVPLQTVTKRFLDWTELHRACTYDVLNASLLMCSFYLLCCMNLVKILDDLWNIFFFFFNVYTEPICLSLRQKHTDEYFSPASNRHEQKNLSCGKCGSSQTPKLGIKQFTWGPPDRANQPCPPKIFRD